MERGERALCTCFPADVEASCSRPNTLGSMNHPSSLEGKSIPLFSLRNNEQYICVYRHKKYTGRWWVHHTCTLPLDSRFPPFHAARLPADKRLKSRGTKSFALLLATTPNLQLSYLLLRPIFNCPSSTAKSLSLSQFHPTPPNLQFTLLPAQ